VRDFSSGQVKINSIAMSNALVIIIAILATLILTFVASILKAKNKRGED
jgi:hypothetical protein